MSLKDAIMSRDECSDSEAQSLIDDMILRVENGENPEEVLYEEGFEPDYIFDILN